MTCPKHLTSFAILDFGVYFDLCKHSKQGIQIPNVNCTSKEMNEILEKEYGLR